VVIGDVLARFIDDALPDGDDVVFATAGAGALSSSL
jgi:hypothetical protein